MFFFLAFSDRSYAWDYGDGRHGSFTLTSSTTIEQLYLNVRLPSDPAVYNPADPKAVPNFKKLTIANNATLSTKSWNGTSGGTLTLKVQNLLTINAGSTITTDGLGYAGGSGIAATGSGPGAGGGGESYRSSRTTRYRGGGGGGYGTTGGTGGDSGGGGGGTYGSEAIDILNLGSGGGGAQAGAGGNGGGAIAISAGRLQVDGELDARGVGGAGYYNGTLAGAGGGSGGSILLRAVSISPGSINAPGGGGGYSGGGSGGSGRIRIESSIGFIGSTTPTASLFDGSSNDTDGDGIPDGVEWGADANMARDSDGDGTLDYLDLDSDNDGIPDAVERGADGVHPVDTDGDGTPDYLDLDGDNDGIPDSVERGPVASTPLDSDKDGTPDYLDLDSDNDGIPDTIERGTDGQNPRDSEQDGIPDYRDSDSNNNGIPDSVEMTPDGAPKLTDTDGDGLPDYWEVFCGLNPNDPSDANTRRAGEQLTYLDKYRAGLNPLLTDTDGDELTDYTELYVAGTNPVLTDTEGDGMPDGWEVSNGLDPRKDDSLGDRDFDFVSNRDEFLGSTNPSSPTSTGSRGLTDYQAKHGGATTWDAIYDRNDRLLGVRHERGISFGFRYDGNGNLVGQAKLARDSDGDGLPDAWEYAHGLNPKSASGDDGANGDPDHDGWTNVQEWMAGSDPKSPSDKPGISGGNVASLEVPFTPTSFVLGTGRLENTALDKIVVAANGDPGTQANVVRVFSQSPDGWTPEDVSIGSYGVTSIAVGTVSNRTPAIYLGLRKTGDHGRVVELVRGDAGWQTNVIAESTSERAEVLGIRSATNGGELVMSYAPRFGPDGGLYRAYFENSAWRAGILNAEPSHRGPGIIATKASSDGADAAIRLLDAGGIQRAAARPSVYPAFDEFNDGFINLTTWMQGGTHGQYGSHSVTEADGLAQLDASFNTSGGNGSNNASAWIQTNNLWNQGQQALVISVTSAGNSTSEPSFISGDCTVEAGGNVIYGSGFNHTDQNILIQVLRIDSVLYSRKSINGGAWSAWTAITSTANSLKFLVNSSTNASNRSLSLSMRVDYVRYVAVSDLLAAGSSPDFTSTDASYRSSTGTWYFKTPTALSWKDAQLYAFHHGGNLVTLDSVDTNTWLQGKLTGDFWIGYYRDFATSPWKWVGSSPATFTPLPWASSQPGAAADQVFAFASNGTWSSATGNEAKPGIYEVKLPSTEASASVDPEPPTSHRLQWSPQTLAAGHFNTAAPSQVSAIEASFNDKDSSTTATSGDEFVVGEFVLDKSPAQVRTLLRPALSGVGLSPSYGIATERSQDGISDFLVTGESDGEVFAWQPTAPGGTLVRKVLSIEHTGKSWQGMAHVTMGGSTEGLVGLRVDPAVPKKAELIFWSSYNLAFTSPPVIPQSPPTARIEPAPNSGGARSLIDVNLWDSEGNSSWINVQFQSTPGGDWKDATLASIDAQAASLPLSSTPQGIVHHVVWNASVDLSPSFNSQILLRSRASDPSGFGAWSSPITYAVDLTTDTDGDGMSDAWENAHGLNPNVNDAMADPDQDDLPNIAEFALNTDPQALTQLADYIKVENGYLTLTMARNPVATKIGFRVEVSADYVTWQSGPSNVVTIEDTPTQFKARDQIPTTATDRRFMRLKLVTP